MGWRGKVCVMAVPSSICYVRRAAPAKTPRGSAPPAPALVSHAAGIPRCSRLAMLVRTAELSGADTTTPSLCCAISSPPMLMPAGPLEPLTGGTAVALLMCFGDLFAERFYLTACSLFAASMMLRRRISTSLE